MIGDTGFDALLKERFRQYSESDHFDKMANSMSKIKKAKRELIQKWRKKNPDKVKVLNKRKADASRERYNTDSVYRQHVRAVLHESYWKNPERYRRKASERYAKYKKNPEFLKKRAEASLNCYHKKASLAKAKGLTCRGQPYKYKPWTEQDKNLLMKGIIPPGRTRKSCYLAARRMGFPFKFNKEENDRFRNCQT